MKIYIIALVLGCIGNMLSINNISCPIGSVVAIVIIGKHINTQINDHLESIKTQLEKQNTP